MTDTLEKTVMDELERRNLELSSLLKSSEKRCAEMEILLKEQNNEVTTLRANTLIMATLEEEVNSLNDTKMKLLEQAKILDAFKKQEQMLRHQLCMLEAERDDARDDHKVKVLDLRKKISLSQEMLMEKNEIISKMENTVKTLFEKCNMLGVSNKDIKEELQSCIESESHFKDFSKKIQFHKTYLEQQIEELVKELKFERTSKGEMDVALATARNEVKERERQITLLSEEKVEVDNKLHYLEEELCSKEKILPITNLEQSSVWRG